MPRLLFLVSSARSLVLADGTSHPAGYFAEEVLTPYERFTAGGVDVVVATPDGEPPCPEPYGLQPMFHYPGEDEDFLASVVRSFAHDVDDIRVTLGHRTELDLIAARRLFEALRAAGWSGAEARHRIEVAARVAWRQYRNFVEVLSEDPEVTSRLPAVELRRLAAQVQRDSATEAAAVAERLAAIPCFQKPVRLAEVSDEEVLAFDGVFVPGGYGPMADMVDNPQVGRVLRLLHDEGRIVAAIGHGPAALLSAGGGPGGEWLFDGFRLTATSDEEEDQTPIGRQGMVRYLETALKNAGALFDDAASAWASHVVVDRNLITAQNPMSVNAAADAVLKRLGSFEGSLTGLPGLVWRRTTETGTPGEVARLFFERLDGHDVEGALALVDPDAEVAFGPARLEGRARGEGQQFLEALVSAFPDLAVRVRTLFAGTDGTVVAEITLEGTQAADFFGIVNQEKHLDLDQAWLLQVAGGHVRRIRAYWCQNQLYRRLAVKRIDQVTITATGNGR